MTQHLIDIQDPNYHEVRVPYPANMAWRAERLGKATYKVGYIGEQVVWVEP